MLQTYNTEEAYAFDDPNQAFAYNPNGTLNNDTYGGGPTSPKLSIVDSGSTTIFNGHTYKKWLVSAPASHPTGTGFVLKVTNTTSVFDAPLPFDVVIGGPTVPTAPGTLTVTVT